MASLLFYMMRHIIFSLLLAALLYPQHKGIPWNTGSSEIDSLVSANISVTGDIMCHSVQYNYARVSADSFDFDPVFSTIKKYLTHTDFLFGNL